MTLPEAPDWLREGWRTQALDVHTVHEKIGSDELACPRAVR